MVKDLSCLIYVMFIEYRSYTEYFIAVLLVGVIEVNSNLFAVLNKLVGM